MDLSLIVTIVASTVAGLWTLLRAGTAIVSTWTSLTASVESLTAATSELKAEMKAFVAATTDRQIHASRRMDGLSDRISKIEWSQKHRQVADRDTQPIHLRPVPASDRDTRED